MIFVHSKITRAFNKYLIEISLLDYQLPSDNLVEIFSLFSIENMKENCSYNKDSDNELEISEKDD